jgi:GT2 family glycosyltransferase
MIRIVKNKVMRIVFCLPGKTFSGNFLVAWTKLLSECLHRGIDVVISQKINSNVYYVRAQCLGASVLRGKKQIPFNGEIDYDYIMWIDSDQVFNPDDFFKLLNHEKDVVGGLYLMEGGRQFAVVKDWDEKFFLENGYFKFLEKDEVMQGDKNLMEVSYTGFGFLLMKKGVFEQLDYPWFEPRIINLTDEISDFASEDVSFCLKAKDAGIKIHIDPTIIVGHEKSTIIHPAINY